MYQDTELGAFLNAAVTVTGVSVCVISGTIISAEGILYIFILSLVIAVLPALSVNSAYSIYGPV